MPRPNYPDQLANLSVDLEALRLYWRKKLITAPAFAKEKARLTARIEFVEDKIEEERLRQIVKAKRFAKLKAKGTQRRLVVLPSRKSSIFGGWRGLLGIMIQSSFH